MVDHSNCKLGKLPPKHDPRVHAFAKYVATDLPAPTPVDWIGNVSSFGAMLNDQIGCCTIASKGHGLQIVTKNARIEFTISDAQVERYYQVIDGYDPSNPATDQGGVISDVLAWIAKHKFAGHALGGYCTVDPKNDIHINQAIALFGDLDVGVALPISAQNQDVWDVPDGQDLTGDWVPGSWGGHDISIHAFSANGDLTCITWGAPKVITRKWFKTYCDEAYALLWAAWIENGGKSPSGFDYDALAVDFAAIRES